METGKIQGDGRKFLQHFKSYRGSQILSQWLNEVHTKYSQNPQQKVSYFF